MKVIICGAGQVGANIARYLATEANDITLIDQSQELIDTITEHLDVRGLVGHASHPDVLELAGAADADLLIAVTYADEVNMIACQIAHTLFKVPIKIARIRAQNYLQPIWGDLFSSDQMPIDVIISPEIEVAQAIVRRLRVPGAFDTIQLAEGRVMLIGVLCGAGCPIINTPLRHLPSLFPDLSIEIVAIERGDFRMIPGLDEQMLEGDEVYFLCDGQHMSRAMAAFGHQEPAARRVMIMGGGNIGLFLAQQLERDFPEINVRLIERNRRRAETIAQILERTVVLHGDAREPEILEEANVAATEAVIAVTDDDEGNVLGSLLAKRYGCDRAITLINKQTYNPLVASLGIDAVVSPKAITVSKILSHIRRGRIHAVHSLLEGFAEVIEIEAMETSPLINKPLEEIRFPPNTSVGAIVRKGEVIMPRPRTVIQAGDDVVMIADHEHVRQVEKMFAVRLEFF